MGCNGSKSEQTVRLNQSELKRFQILRGNFDDVPSQPPTDVRIFVSSTFKDFQEERNYLIEYAYEELRNYCREQYQKDFILIDMRWGITDEASDQQVTTIICLNEIEKCQTQSIGPSFVALISHRYGGRFLKPIIDEEEFELIKKEIIGLNDENITNILQSFYELNENVVNKREYKLRSVKSICERLSIDQKGYRKVQDTLIDSIRQAIDKNAAKNKITKKDRDTYFTSVTEQEIQQGLLDEHNAHDKCVAFIREITNFDNESKESRAFVDTDAESKTLLDDLKKRIELKLPFENKHLFQLDWFKVNKFNSPYTDEMTKYIETFGSNFKQSIITLIDRYMSKPINKIEICDPEVTHHALFCNKLSKQFHVRSMLFEKLNTYLMDPFNNKPFVITAVSGAGKSSLIAYAAKQVKQLNDVLIVRFMGTSRNSSTIRYVFISILKQLGDIYGIRRNAVVEKESYETIGEIRDRLIRQLKDISENHPNEKLIILLDSIDQLSKQDYNLDWMFYELPKNVKIVYSVLSNYEGILKRLKSKLPYESNYLEINNLEFSESKEMLQEWLKGINCKLSESQWTAIDTCLTKTPEIYPLHIKLLFDIASKWSSEHIVDNEFTNCTTTKGTIKYLYKNLEKFHGKILFSRCIFYLTLFEYNGISESELEDILSIDDDVLTSVFAHHHPPVRRFPIALWLNIKHELKDYVTNKETDGVLVISWFHRTFIEASQEYYVEMFKSSSLKDSILMNVIDYFTERWNPYKSDGKAGEMKEFEYKKGKLNKFEYSKKSNGTEYVAYRNTKPQNLEFEFKQGNEKIKGYNRRKLNELTNVIFLLQDGLTKIELLKEYIYFNYDFMHAKAKLREIDFVIEMHTQLEALKNKLPDEREHIEEMLKISEIYKNQYPKIQQNPDCLYFEVLSRLNHRSKYVENFAKSFGLMLSCKVIQNESTKNLFICESDSCIVAMYTLRDSPFMFIETETRKDSLTTLTLINTLNTKLIGMLEFKMKTKSIQITFGEEPIESMKQLSDLNGNAFFVSSSQVFSATFDNDITSLKEYKNEILEIQLFSSNCLLVVSKKSLILVFLTENKQEIKEEFEIDEEDEIKLVEYSVSKQRVFSLKDLNALDSIKFVVGLANKLIKVYKFDQNSQSATLMCHIDSFNWTYYGYETDRHGTYWRESILIDKSYSRNDGTRFTVEDDGVWNVVQIDSDGNYTIIEKIGENRLEVTESDKAYKPNEKLQLEDFWKNKIFLKMEIEYGKWNAYIYDIESRKYIKRQNVWADRINTIDESDLIIAESLGQFRFYKIDFNDILEISKIKTPFVNKFSEAKREIKFKNGKLMIIDPDKKQSIIEINHLSKRKDILINSGGEIDKVLCVIDKKHVLVTSKRNDSLFEVAIINATTQNKISSFFINSHHRVMSVLGSNSDNIVVYNTNDAILYIYRIEKKLTSFNFIELLKEEVSEGVATDWNTYKNLNKCHFDDFKTNNLYITLFDSKENRLLVNYIEHFNPNKMSTESEVVISAKCTKEAFVVDLAAVKLDFNVMRCCITSYNKYLVLWQMKDNDIYYIDIFKNEVFLKSTIDRRLTDVMYVPSKDDLIAQIGNIVCYLKVNYANSQLETHEIKEYRNENLKIKLEGEYFLVTFATENILDIFKVYELQRLNFKKLDQFKYTRSFCVSSGSRYIIIQTTDNILRVLDVNDSNTITQTASLQLNDSATQLLASDECISCMSISNNAFQYMSFTII